MPYKSYFSLSSKQVERTTKNSYDNRTDSLAEKVDSQSDMPIPYVSEERNLEHSS